MYCVTMKAVENLGKPKEMLEISLPLSYYL